jgi:hypothetical protein
MSFHTTEEMRTARAERRKYGVSRYKFMSLKYLNSLSSDQIFMSDPSEFNDPFDLKIEIGNLIDRSPFDNEEILRQAFGKLFVGNNTIENFWYYDKQFIDTLQAWIDGTAHYGDVIAGFKRRSTEFGVSCFSQDWDVPLMWSHYAQSHKGICVEYQVHPMKMNRYSEDLYFGQHYVRYTTELPTLCLTEVLFSPHQVLSSILATKHADWSYEREWRLIHYAAKGKMVSAPKAMEISAIIVGLDFNMANMAEVVEKATQLNIPVYKINRQMGYDLKLEPY